ncbi:MAG: hypothetical protein Q9165_005849 [Trypethelium subeluteriae]
MPAVGFDWNDSSTFENPFQYQFPHGETIRAVYLVAAGNADPAPKMNAFIDLARQKYGVKRFVLIAGSSTEPGERHIGRKTIKLEGKIYTACGDAKIPFISATDIAHVAFRALTDARPHNCDYRILGPELLTYDDIAAKLTKHLGRKIDHVKLSDEERKRRFVDFGLPNHYAQLMVKLEALSRSGSENRMNDAVQQVTGREPTTFDRFAEESKGSWQ